MARRTPPRSDDTPGAPAAGEEHRTRPAKERADQLMVEQGLAESRERAKRLLMAGQVFLHKEGRREPVDKPGRLLPRDSVLELAQAERFVSRGGYKLLTALESLGIDVQDKVALDAGASTGGFTDCLLQHGAKRVYAVDVGKAQLHEKLRADPRVISLEGVNLRHATPGLLPEPVDFLVADLSFISLRTVLPALCGLLAPVAEAVLLVKPQFELGPGQAVKGVVRDPELQQEAVRLVREAAQALGFRDSGVAPSAIKGPKGNQEYLLHLLWGR